MIYHQGERFTLYQGDNREILPTLPENSVDAIVTDPPYELGFMGKSWDASGVAFDAAMWREAMRVLKPGGHLLAFSGSRTYHRIAVAIEDAGFEIRDQIMWIYGSGFPKSLDVSKAIDKAAGVEREILGIARLQPDIRGNNYAQGQREYGGDTVPQYITKPATDAAKQWQGWGTALKPAHEPIVVARKPLIGTVSENVLTYGTGGLNIDGARVATQDSFGGGAKGTSGFAQGYDGEGWQAGSDLGRWPANVIHDGSEEVLELFPNSKGGVFPAKRGNAVNTSFASGQETEGGFRAMGDDGSAARFFYCAKTSKRDRNEGLDGFEEKQTLGGGGLTASIRDDGSYETASAGGKYGSVKAKQTNHHPTVKPTDLMRYLCRLVTPKGGIVLDPFTGSGSTGKAAIYEGFNFIGIEMTDEYLPIAKARIEFALNNREETLFDA